MVKGRSHPVSPRREVTSGINALTFRSYQPLSMTLHNSISAVSQLDTQGYVVIVMLFGCLLWCITYSHSQKTPICFLSQKIFSVGK